VPSIAAINAAGVVPCSLVICFKLFQNSSSRLTLVLWPSMTIERFVVRFVTEGVRRPRN